MSLGVHVPCGVQAPVLPQAARPGERSSALMDSSPRAWAQNRGWREEPGSDGKQPLGLGAEPGLERGARL